jgi:hypothetical protein
LAVLDGSPRTYLKTAVLTWLGLSLLCVALCIFADPYRLFGTPALEGLTALKPRSYQQLLMAKTVLLDRARARTLLLGNSRVENGFDPDSRVWPAHMQPVFNAGLPGYDMAMAERMLDEALADGGGLKTVILEADFPDFLRPSVAADYERPLSDDEKRLKVDRDGARNGARTIQLGQDWLHAALTLDALYDSAVTLLNQNPRFGATMTPAGFNPLREYELEVRRIGYEGLFAQKEAAYRLQMGRAFHADFRHPEQSENFRFLRRIIQKAAKNDIKLLIFVPPYHARFLQIVRDQGLWPEFENWKRALVQVVAANAGPGVDVELVDFSGPSPFVAELVPSKGDTGSAMRWYWEPGHYKSALGDEVLKRLITGQGAFGETLSPATIEAVLMRETTRGQTLR